MPIAEREAFWKLVDSTVRFEDQPQRQLTDLHDKLARLSIEAVAQYESSFDAEMKRSYSWDLWGAAYVVHGGASDDSFEYFRCWLISKGRGTFEAVLADPDSLADRVARDPHGPLEFEDFAYVARKVWSEKSGRPAGQMPGTAWMMYPGTEPTGKPFDDNPAAFAKRYPKLWKRFGNSPLG